MAYRTERGKDTGASGPADSWCTPPLSAYGLPTLSSLPSLSSLFSLSSSLPSSLKGSRPRAHLLTTAAAGSQCGIPQVCIGVRARGRERDKGTKGATGEDITRGVMGPRPTRGSGDEPC